MDGQSPQQEKPTVFAKSPSSISNNVILISAMILLLGFFLGFLTVSLVRFNKLPISPSQQVILPSILPPKQTIDESTLPVSLSLLTNPIVYEWRGSVKGKLTKKDEHTFTLVDDKGNSITITDIMPSGDIFKTVFFDKTKTDREKKEVSLSTLPLGSILLGDFFIFKDGFNTPVGSSFVKQE